MSRDLNRRDFLTTAGLALGALGVGSTAALGQTPKAGGTLLSAQTTEATGLDPQLVAAFSRSRRSPMMYNQLVRFEPDMTPVPELAESWHTSPDGLTWTFKLREGVKFHDGQELTSADVKFTFDRLFEKSPGKSDFIAVDKVEPAGKYAVKFITKEPFAGLLAALGGFWGFIISEAGIKKHGDLNKAALGTGPFVLEDWKVEQQMVLKKNPHYFKKGRPYVDQIVLRTIPDEANIVAALRTGQIQHAFIEDNKNYNLLKDEKSLTGYRSSRLGYDFLNINATRGPLKDVRVRQAISWTVDRAQVLRVAASGFGRLTAPATAPMRQWQLPEEQWMRQALAGQGLRPDDEHHAGLRRPRHRVLPRAALHQGPELELVERAGPRRHAGGGPAHAGSQEAQGDLRPRAAHDPRERAAAVALLRRHDRLHPDGGEGLPAAPDHAALRLRGRLARQGVMGRYLLVRLYSMAVTLLGLTVLTFLMLRLIPGTVVEQMIGADAIVSEAMVAQLKAFFGLDQPWYVQYGRWMGSLLQGDLGTSWRTGKPVVQLIGERLPVTLELTAFAVAVAIMLGVVAGVVSSVRRDRAVDNITRVGALLGLSVPVFWQGTMLILFLSIYLRWMPPVVWVDFFADPLRNLTIMLLPALCLGTASAANIARTTRACMLDVLGSEYIRTAAAKGLRPRLVVLKHALRNAMIPIVTVVGLQIGILLGGTVVVEEVFTLPGVGRLVLWSIYQRDYPLTQSTILFVAVMFMTVNLAVDLLYAYLDPRIRY